MFVVTSKFIEDFIDFEGKNIYDILKKKEFHYGFQFQKRSSYILKR